MKNLGDMMKQVQAMQSKMADMQTKLEAATVKFKELGTRAATWAGARFSGAAAR